MECQGHFPNGTPPKTNGWNLEMMVSKFGISWLPGIDFQVPCWFSGEYGTMIPPMIEHRLCYEFHLTLVDWEFCKGGLVFWAAYQLRISVCPPGRRKKYIPWASKPLKYPGFASKTEVRPGKPGFVEKNRFFPKTRVFPPIPFSIHNLNFENDSLFGCPEWIL